MVRGTPASNTTFAASGSVYSNRTVSITILRGAVPQPLAGREAYTGGEGGPETHNAHCASGL